MPSVDNDLLWPPDSQQASLQKIGRGASTSIKEEDMLQSSMSQIHKSSEQMNQNQTDSLFFPVSIPVHCSREEAAAVTSTLHTFYRQNPIEVFANTVSSFHDDPLMQEAINVANPSTILPNSMMGGNPGSYRSSIRQRHFSEGSVLKKSFQESEIVCKPEGNCPPTNFVPGHSDVSSDGVNLSIATGNIATSVSPGTKRKATETETTGQMKKVKTEMEPAHNENKDDNTKEIWSVPKHAAPNRQRHRRHSADSRLQFKSMSLLPRSSLQANVRSMPGHGGNTGVPGDTRGKRGRPPPLIIPPSVNAYSNGARFISQLHHRRR